MKSLLVILFTLTTFILLAQPEHVFEIVGDNTGLLTAKEKTTARRLKEHPRIAQGWTIALSKIENNKNLKMTIKLPGIGQPLDMTSSHSYELEQELFLKTKFTVWGGKLKGAKKEGEFVIMKADNGAIGGMMQFNNRIFELIPVNEKAGVLRRVNPNHSKGRNCPFGQNRGIEEEITESNSSNFNASLMTPCDEVTTTNCPKRRWKILVGYTQATLDDIVFQSNGNIWAQIIAIGLPKATLNTTLLNSNLTAVPVSMVDVNIDDEAAERNIDAWRPLGFPFCGGPTDYDCGLIDARRISNALRGEYNHDRLAVMTVHDYANISGIASSVYSTTGNYDHTKDAALVEFWTSYFPELTFAHEIGHMWGANHDNALPDDDYPCYQGYIFGLGGIDRTLMATLNPPNFVPSSSSGMVFSDPNNTYEYNGQQVVIGTTARNNQNIVEYTMCLQGANFTGGQDEVYFRFLNSESEKENTTIYPNPVGDFLYINKIDDLQSLKLISIDGKILKNLDVNSLKSNGLNVNDLEEGAYLINLQYSNSAKILKFIKQ